MTGVKVIIFQVHGQKYGIDISLISGIEKEQSIVAVPNSPACIKGIINLRGEIVPVYNLCHKFHLPELNDRETQLIVINRDDVHVALEVEGVEEIADIDGDKISEPPKLIQNNQTKYLSSVAKENDRLIILLDVKQLITEEEAEDIGNFLESQKQ